MKSAILCLFLRNVLKKQIRLEAAVLAKTPLLGGAETILRDARELGLAFACPCPSLCLLLLDTQESLESPGALRQIQSPAGFRRRSELAKHWGTSVGEKLGNLRADGWQPARLMGHKGER